MLSSFVIACYEIYAILNYLQHYNLPSYVSMLFLELIYFYPRHLTFYEIADTFVNVNIATLLNTDHTSDGMLHRKPTRDDTKQGFHIYLENVLLK